MIEPSLLRGSSARRGELLRGLLDVSGSWDQHQVVFTASSSALARSVGELVRTLGMVPTVVDGSDEVSTVSFDPGGRVRGHDGSFLIELSGQRQSHVITNVVEVDPVPTQCVEVDAADRLYLCGESLVPTHNSGKMPQLKWAADKFNAMKVYAVLLHHELNEVPRRLRLVYIGGQGRERVLQLDIDERTLESTRGRMKAVSAAVARSHARWDWPARTSKLCNWCDFQEICPAMGGPLADAPVTVRRRVSRPEQSGGAGLAT
jgi:CRISPR/Cas system-associated exonuclease Cas4 (RecB family)